MGKKRQTSQRKIAIKLLKTKTVWCHLLSQVSRVQREHHGHRRPALICCWAPVCAASLRAITKLRREKQWREEEDVFQISTLAILVATY